MSFPEMGRSGRARVNIPELRGGVNYRDALSAVEDNQLTDVKNMWFKDGALRTRPAMKIPHEDGVAYTTEYEAYSSTSWRKCQCPSGYTIIYAPSAMYSGMLYNLYTFDVDGYFVGASEVSGLSLLIVPYGKTYDGKLYEAVAYSSGTSGRFVYGLTIGAAGAEAEEIEPYIPILMINGKGRALVDADAPSGSMLEGYSLLTDKYRACFNTDAQSVKYYLPTAMTPYSVTLEFRQGDTVWTWETLGTAAKAEKNGRTTITAKLSDEGKCIELSAALPEVAGKSNNLFVTGRALNYAQETDIAMAEAYTWFGGTRGGINGGSRLFIGMGNSVYWSETGNPFYFSENNYVNVGSATDRVTGFGKQSDALVIFKEREIYYTTYTEGVSYTAEDVVNGNVVDVTTLSAVFPLAQLSGNIGCDLPETIKMMQNRLVWADSAGKVWTLVYTSEYNQKNVRPVGGLIERKLKAHNLDRVSAAVYGDYYILLVTDETGTTGYALDTAEYGYAHYTGYRSDSNAQRKMAWYVWTFPKIDGNGVTVLGSSENSTGAVLFTLENEMNETGMRTLMAYALGDGEDEETDFSGNYAQSPIACMFKTKLFDMGRPERAKMFDRLYIGFGQTESLNAKLTYITEKGEFEDSYTVKAESVQTPWTAQFIRTEPVTPNMRCRRMAVKVANTGEMYIEGMVLSYRV